MIVEDYIAARGLFNHKRTSVFQMAGVAMRLMSMLAGLGVAALLATPAAAGPASAEDAPNLLGIDHVALHVKSLERSSAWYEKHFGLHILHTWSGVWMVGRGNIKLGLFLTSPLNDVSDPEHAAIIEHFAFAVDGDKFQAMVDRLRSQGLAVGEVEDTGIAYSVFVKDPDGHSVEITTYYPKAEPK